MHESQIKQLKEKLAHKVHSLQSSYQEIQTVITQAAKYIGKSDEFLSNK